jgi:soluble lytic murein transglycosylase-like protein
MSRFFVPCVLALFTFLPSKGVDADVYKFVDATGHVFYTDKPKHSGFKLILRSPRPPAFSYVSNNAGRTRLVGKDGGLIGSQLSAYRAQKQQELAPIINAAADRYSLDPALLHAVIRAESGYNSEAVSHKGAAGLMQLMPATASRYGVRDRFDPQENIEGGARYLSDLLDMFPSNVKLAVAAYNSGENTVKRFGNQVPPIAETQNYVDRVLGYYYR